MLFHDVLKMKLRNGAFSLVIDETIDISITKDLALVCPFYTKEESIGSVL